MPAATLSASRAMNMLIAPALRAKHGYPEITPALRAKVFGLNALKIYSVPDEQLGRYRPDADGRLQLISMEELWT